MARQIVLLLVVAVVAYLAGRLSAPETQTSISTPAAVDGDRAGTVAPSPTQITQTTGKASQPPPGQSSTDDDIAALEAAALQDQYATSPAQRKRDIQATYRRYAQIDPMAALAHAQTLTDSFSRRAGVLAVIEQISETDPEFALQAIENVDSTLLHVSLRLVALRGMALRDPVRAAQLVTELPGNTHAYRDVVFRQWATYAPRDAIEFANAQTDAESRSLGRGIALGNWVATDPDEALAWFESVRDTLNDDEFNSLAFTLARTLPERTESIAALLRPQMRRMLISERIRMSARDDPQAAAAILEQTRDQMERGAMVGTIADGFAKRDLAAGLTWAESLKGHEKRRALNRLYGEWFRDDADAALAYVNNLPEKQRAKLSEAVISGLANNDPARAFEWLRNQPDGMNNQQNLLHVAMSWSMRDADEAVSALAAYQNEPWGKDAVTAALMQMSQSDPAGAQGWVLRLEEPDTQLSAARTVASGMAQANPDDALKWARSLSGDVRDSALAGAIQFEGIAPAEAYDITQSINDDAIRLKAIEGLFYRTVQSNPDLAREWVEGSSFDTPTRDRLLGMIEGR